MPDIDHSEALQLITQDWEADSDNRKDALHDLRFLASDQWTQTERNERQDAKRPTLTVNHLNKFVNQVGGDIRQGQFGIEVFPVDNEEDVTTAQIFEGLIRQIEYQSNAQTAYAHGAESAVRCSIGHWRINTIRPTHAPFNQEIRIERIIDPLSVVWDADSVTIDGSDATRCWVTEWVHETAWKRRFPNIGDRQLTDVPVDGIDGHTSGLFWRRDRFVRIAEYFYHVPTKRRMFLLQDGSIWDEENIKPEFMQQLRFGGFILEELEVESHEVKRRMMDGSDWLDDEQDWAGKDIPIVKCVGTEVAFDGKVVRKSLIRDAKDAQKMLNIWRSAAAEVVQKSPKAPWLVSKRMVEGYEDYWSDANNSNLPFLPFNPDDKVAGGMPKRQDPPTLPTAIIQEATLAVDDMKATTGIFDASLGERSNETSGRAILARQREGDTGSFVFFDNFAAAIKRTGELLIDLIPRIYDAERQIRILQPDETEAFVPINTQLQDPTTGEELLVNDLAQGRFDVRVKIGASHTTAREQAREQMTQALQSNPNLWQIIGDLVFKNSDFPGSEEIAERIKKTIDPRILGEDGEETEAEQDPMAEAAIRLAEEKELREIAKLEAEGEEAEAKAEKTRAEARKIEKDADSKELETEVTFQQLGV